MKNEDILSREELKTILKRNPYWVFYHLSEGHLFSDTFSKNDISFAFSQALQEFFRFQNSIAEEEPIEIEMVWIDPRTGQDLREGENSDPTIERLFSGFSSSYYKEYCLDACISYILEDLEDLPKKKRESIIKNIKLAPDDFDGLSQEEMSWETRLNIVLT